ncbi:FAD-binding oxidoreductase (plasmid) [Deinococcus psychrotolerans]|uniref:FAD-binding oxidoreductase n=1 Tax=Deinococcus psychrotolerans TaxID=2489213 RepID=A0A3G8YLE7_9DEIO|nr:FAD-dependent oxidoreductase [Deinococcus psychrotolerans]AZI45117.1 FAD-binding oxidoreductase [Deinococcus psychrotolerans]
MHAIVIGGGMVGAACADALALNGVRVTVLEPGPVGGGATAAGMGHLVVMDDSPAQLALTSRSLELWEALARDLPAQADYHACGTLWVASDAEELEAVEPKRQAYLAAGRGALLLNAAELAHAEPNLRPGLAGALRVPGDSVVYAPVVAQFLLERAGATVRRGAVTELIEGGVRLASGESLHADLVVVANGIGAAGLLPGLPLRQRKGHLLITERGALKVNHQLVELGYLKSAHGGDEDSVAFNVQPRPTGQLLIGSSRQFERPDREIDWPLLRRMLRRAAEFLPALAQTSALRVWTGQRCATPDHLPLIGPHPDLDGVFLATGHEGLGITTALGTAEVLAAQLFGGFSELLAHDFTPARFGRMLEAVHA